MSRLSELLKARIPNANSANPANLHTTSDVNSQDSQDSQQVRMPLPLTADLEQRYRAMCSRWRYSTDEVIDGLNAARQDPAKAWLAVLADERRAAAERSRWLGDG